MSEKKGNLKRRGSTCIVSIDATPVPTFRVDGPYGSPNQVNVLFMFGTFL